MYYIGIDLGGTNIATGLVNNKGEIICKAKLPTKKERDWTEIVKDMAETAKQVIDKSGIDKSEIDSIGIGSPGSIDCKNGIILFAGNLPFKNVPLKDELQKYIDLPVYIDNDANCAALAESVVGAAKDVKDSVMITIGTGVGGGVIIDNKIFNGANSAASEIGHMVMEVDGKPCTCGRKGCYEAYASASAIIRETKDAIKKNPDSITAKLVDNQLDKVDAKTAFDAARKGDAVGAGVVNNFIKYLGEGILNVISLFQPELIVIGGGVCKEGDFLLDPLRKYVSERIFAGDYLEPPKIVTAKTGNDAGIIGAAMLALS